MTSTEPTTTSPASSRATDEEAELARAASDLEALADAYDECCRSLESLEAAVDTLLDDAATCALVLDDEHRVVAISRGMASVLEVERSVLGVAVARVLPPGWRGLPAALADLTHDEGWRTMPVGEEGSVRARRATEDDRPAIYVVRCPAPGT